VKQRWPLYFLPSNVSFAEVPGLERELKANVPPEMVRKIAAAGADGRVLAVNTTNVDDGVPHVFDLVAEARHAIDSGNYDRFQQIMLASAGIPGAFPFRVIDNEMYVDGGITGNIIYGGRLKEDDTLPAIWQKTYPDLPIPKTRFWVIFNNKLRPLPQVTEPNWPAVVQRSMEMATRAATITAMRHLLAMAEITRLKRHADVEVRIVAVPADWVPLKEGVFVKETMNNLADLGTQMGADPKSWSTELPP
jgi:predicted acylesterase/phospholipase RssA